MKRIALILIITLMGVTSTFARGLMSFSQAQEHAYFLTDKMAYELDLTPSQYDQVYQVNLEYFINASEPSLFGYYWEYRNADLSYILFDWQYSLYRRTPYFYRPIEMRRNVYYMPLWERYHRTYFFFGRPTIWNTWRGGLWVNRTHHSPSPFVGHRPSVHNGGMRHDRQPGGHIGGNPGGKPGHNSYYNPGGSKPQGNGGVNSGNRPSTNGGSNYRPNSSSNGHIGGGMDNNRGNGHNGSSSSSVSTPSRGGVTPSRGGATPSRGGATPSRGNAAPSRGVSSSRTGSSAGSHVGAGNR